MINLKDYLEEYEKARKEWNKEVDLTYNPRNIQIIRNFLLSTGDITLKNMCTEEMREFLFKNDGKNIPLSIDELSQERKEKHRENNFFASYFYESLREDMHKGSSMNVDILVSKKTIPKQLREILEECGFFSNHLIDFETLEFPHFENQIYYGDYSSKVIELNKRLDKKNKDISKSFKNNPERLYRDVEKFHLIFAAGGKRESQEIEFIPVYIGFGTNEICGLTFEGSLGKSRFMKWSFDSENCGFEEGKLVEKKINERELSKRFGSLRELVLFYGKNYTINTLEDETFNPIYPSFRGGVFDEDRFKGFLKSDNKRNMSIITPEFSFKGISQKEYFNAVLNNREIGIPVIRNQQDIFNLLENNLLKYEEFSSLMYYPRNIVKEFGIEKCFKMINSKLHSGEFIYLDSLNIASDIYRIQTESHERLKLSSIVIGNYIKSGKFLDLLNATYEGKKINPL